MDIFLKLEIQAFLRSFETMTPEEAKAGWSEIQGIAKYQADLLEEKEMVANDN